MTVKLLIIGQPTRRDDVLEDVASRVANSRTTIIRRCEAPDSLLGVVDEVRKVHGKIDSLDLYDHGLPGTMHMGNGILFESDRDPRSEPTGGAIAIQLVPLLSELAQVRLLGCDTAELRKDLTPGRLLLLKLAKRLGTRHIVSGTLAQIDPDDFDSEGFRAEKEVELLFSARAALDVAVPTYEDHMLNLDETWLSVSGGTPAQRSVDRS
jgi:hypothetical protein